MKLKGRYTNVQFEVKKYCDRYSTNFWNMDVHVLVQDLTWI